MHAKGITVPENHYELLGYFREYWNHIESGGETKIRTIRSFNKTQEMVEDYIIPGMNIIAAHLYWKDKTPMEEEVGEGVNRKSTLQHHTPEGMYERIADKLVSDLDDKFSDKLFKGWHHYFGESFSDTIRNMYGDAPIKDPAGEDFKTWLNMGKGSNLDGMLEEKEDMSRVISIDSLSEMVKDEAIRKMDKHLNRLEECANEIEHENTLPDTEYNEEGDQLDVMIIKTDSKSYFLSEMHKALESDGSVSLCMVRAKVDNMKNLFVRTNVYTKGDINAFLVRGNLFNPSYEDANTGRSCVLYWSLKCNHGNSSSILTKNIELFHMIDRNDTFYTVYANNIPSDLMTLDEIPDTIKEAFK